MVLDTFLTSMGIGNVSFYKQEIYFDGYTESTSSSGTNMIEMSSSSVSRADSSI